MAGKKSGKATTPVALNTTPTQATATQLAALTKFVGKLRALRAEGELKRIEMWAVAYDFDKSGVWRVYRLWSLARVLREETGISFNEYTVYRDSRDITALSDTEIRQLGPVAVKIMIETMRRATRANPAVAPATVQQFARNVLTKICAWTSQHGFTPPRRTATAITQAEATKIGLVVTQATRRDRVSARYQLLLDAVKQIEAMGPNAHCKQCVDTYLVATNVLRKLNGQPPIKTRPRPRPRSTTASTTAPI